MQNSGKSIGQTLLLGAGRPKIFRGKKKGAVFFACVAFAIGGGEEGKIQKIAGDEETADKTGGWKMKKKVRKKVEIKNLRVYCVRLRSRVDYYGGCSVEIYSPGGSRQMGVKEGGGGVVRGFLANGPFL